MEKATREKLAKIAKDMAQVPFHGDVDGMASNLASIVRLFPTWNLRVMVCGVCLLLLHGSGIRNPIQTRGM